MRKNSLAAVFIRLLSGLCLLLALEAASHALTIASPAPLPAGINRADHDKLQSRKASLDTQRQELEADIGALNSECSRVPASDSARAQACGRRQAQLLGRIADYRTAVESYTQQIQLVSLLSPGPLVTSDASLHTRPPTAQELLEARQRIVALEKDVRKIQGRLKVVTQALLANNAEFETWKKTVDDAVNDTWEKGLDYLLGLPFDLGTYKLGNLLENRLKEIEKHSIRSADLLASTADPAKRERYRAVRQWLAREKKLARYNQQQLKNLGALKTTYDLRAWDKSKAADYERVVDGLSWLAGVVAPPFSHLKMSVEAYSNVAAECVSWHKINGLSRQNDDYAVRVKELSFRMEKDIGEIGCLKGCLQDYSESCLNRCAGGSKLHKPPPLLD
jgi:outer membrane murein-binding lipoprotein Lpp